MQWNELRGRRTAYEKALTDIIVADSQSSTATDETETWSFVW